MKADSGMTTELETPVGSDVDVAWLRLGGPEGEDTRDDIPSPQIASQRRKRQPRPKVDIAPRRMSTGFRAGDIVLTNCPRSKVFHNRQGRVTSNNFGEVGLTFDKDGAGKSDNTDAWFAPGELTKIGHQDPVDPSELAASMARHPSGKDGQA